MNKTGGDTDGEPFGSMHCNCVGIAEGELADMHKRCADAIADMHFAQRAANEMQDRLTALRAGMAALLGD